MGTGWAFERYWMGTGWVLDEDWMSPSSPDPVPPAYLSTSSDAGQGMSLIDWSIILFNPGVLELLPRAAPHGQHAIEWGISRVP